MLVPEMEPTGERQVGARSFINLAGGDVYEAFEW